MNIKILIAEDDTAPRLALKRIFQKWGYVVVVAKDGNEAWQLLQAERPGIAVLDWMMPCINGVELCRKIREKQDTGYTYIILLTSKVENKDIVVGLDAGADDYIVKPFNTEILRSRVNVGVRVVEYEAGLAEKNAQLQRYSDEMERLAEERSKQLIHAERMATVGLLSAGIAHEINNPTTFIAGNAQTLERFWQDVKPTFQQQISIAGADREKLEFILEAMPKILNGIHNGVKRISRIVKGLKAFCHQQEETKGACNVNDSVEQSLEFCHNALKYHVTVQKNLAGDIPEIMADSQQIEQVLINLFVNAADAIEENCEGTLTIQTQHKDNTVVISVDDTGHGIPEDKLDDIWQPFFTTKVVGKGTGLGLSTVLGIIQNHDGQIKVENKSTGGALFTITLPAILQGDKKIESEIVNSR
ncbi:MAG TPA: response regulator [Phycisphaerales bacterium]|nr:response regulator [Phycisphaerales bacterium]